MYIKKDKKTSPSNENAFKAIGRSYSNSENFIDFNRLDFAMQKDNDYLGLEEFSMEYSIKNSSAPIPGQYINYNNIKWYISSVDRTISIDNDIVMINLVRDYNKIAEAIGLKTQFESTKLPLNNIIDRHIYIENNSSFELYNDMYVGLVVNDKTLYKRVAVLQANKGVYVTFEALDNYAFDRTVDAISGSSLYTVTEVPYGDSEYNEQMYYYVNLYKIEDLTIQESLGLPYLPNSNNKIVPLTTGISRITAFKDARERLIFTLYFPNALYFDDPNTRVIIPTITVNEYITSYKIERVHSVVGAKLGEISVNSPLYTGDVINVSATTHVGYYIQDYIGQHTVGYGPVHIKLLAYPQIEAVNPVLQNFKLTPLNSSHVLDGEILNNNSIMVQANVEIYYLVGMTKQIVMSTTEYILPNGLLSVLVNTGSWSEYVVEVTFINVAFKENPTISKTVKVINEENRT